MLISQSPNGLENEKGWDNSPEGIADWLNWYDSLQPPIFSADERAARDAERQTRKEWELKHFDERAGTLQRQWQ